jgi:hypothetical protein
MEQDECPICVEPLSGTLATLGCCRKVLHVECLVKCMKVKLDCPMCRARHESMHMVQDVESQRLVPVAVQYRTKNVYRELFTFTLLSCVVTLSYLYYR